MFIIFNIISYANERGCCAEAKLTEKPEIRSKGIILDIILKMIGKDNELCIETLMKGSSKKKIENRVTTSLKNE